MVTGEAEHSGRPMQDRCQPSGGFNDVLQFGITKLGLPVEGQLGGLADGVGDFGDIAHMRHPITKVKSGEAPRLL